MKRLLLAAALAAALPAFGRVEGPDTRRRPNQDEAELTRLAKLYERAVNENNVELLVPLVEAGTDIMSVTGTRVTSVAELRAFWDRLQKAKNSGGRQGKHTTKVTIDSLEIDGNRARVRGRADEEFITGDGRVMRYQLPFDSEGVKSGGRWRLTKMHTRANFLDKVTIAARAIAISLWRPRLQLKDTNAAPPDWDQDRGANDKDAAAAMGASGPRVWASGPGARPAAPPAAAAVARPAVRRAPPPPPPMTRTAR